LSLDDLRKGTERDDGPRVTCRGTIESTKVGGGEIGLIIKDARR